MLDGKRSLNVNIFLRQFQQSLSAADIVKHLLTTTTHGAGDQGGAGRRHADAETLACLLKIAPDDNEVQRLTAFSGDRRRLGVAERFLTELIALPKYVCQRTFYFSVHLYKSRQIRTDLARGRKHVRVGAARVSRPTSSGNTLEAYLR